ncbi:MAG TPA: permease prefix domain 1-containing protein [Chloroflexota bacterium]
MSQFEGYLEAIRRYAGGRLSEEAERELRAHFEEAVAAQRAAGWAPEEAEARALAELGRPKDVAAAFRREGRRGLLRLAGGPDLVIHADTGWLALLLVSLVGSSWLLSTRALHRAFLDLLGERSYLPFLFLAVPAFTGASLWSVLHFSRRFTTRRGLAALPLLVNALALGIFLFAPITRALDALDFRLHYEARAEVVQRVEAGEFWSGSPAVSAVMLPQEYPRSVSDGAGQRSIVVYHEDGALHIVFFLHRGLRGESSAFLYRSDGRPPSLPNRYLPYAVASEQVADRWYRVVFH